MGKNTKKGVVLKDVEPNDFVATYAAYLKKTGKIELPAWVDLIKLAPFKELAPTSSDWYYFRCAAIARRVYLRPGTGIGGLTKVFGGNSRRGVITDRFNRAARGNIRHCLQQLEKIGIVEHTPKGGRKMTPEGMRDLDRIAQRIVFPHLFESS
eukprot:NODE_10890_length_572_cov_393.340757_g10613_i0.p1 GENE.NODE_10890_length_572_cov_393.340757_g10613_i0~~NODE_10890_length_572_cov_393.340757_g10613_i0.p1  ORF type:complete len:171 (+),score=61.93 NODE_10890_length_572_cov_393.340757_g10613_i0:55-513(+)